MSLAIAVLSGVVVSLALVVAVVTVSAAEDRRRTTAAREQTALDLRQAEERRYAEHRALMDRTFAIAERQAAAHLEQIDRLLTSVLTPDERLSIRKLEIAAEQAVEISRAKAAERVVNPLEQADRRDRQRVESRYEEVVG